MTKEYVQIVGRMAYVWEYAMVNAHDKRVAFSEAPAAGLLGGIVPIALNDTWLPPDVVKVN